jgi:hypothetical protein
MLETRAFQQAYLVPRKWLLEFQQRGLLFLQPFLGKLRREYITNRKRALDPNAVREIWPVSLRSYSEYLNLAWL